MAKFLPPKARVVVFTGMLQSEIQSKEVTSFSSAFEQFSSGGRVLEVIENHENVEEAFEKCSSLLKRVRKLDGMYISTATCLPICSALDAAGLAGRVKLVTTDLFPAMVPWFERGTILASIYQRPYVQGQTAVGLVMDHLLGGRPFPRTCYLTPLVALRSNLKTFREISNKENSDEADSR
jgi:LacI family transcriptional regulator